MTTLGETNPDAFNRLKYPEAYNKGSQRAAHGFGNKNPMAPSSRGFSAGGGQPTLGGGQNFSLPGKEGLSTIPKNQNLIARGNTSMANVPGTEGVTVGDPRRPQALRTTRPATPARAPSANIPRLGGPAAPVTNTGPISWTDGMRSIAGGGAGKTIASLLRNLGGAISLPGTADAAIDLLPSSWTGRDDMLDMYVKNQERRQRIFSGESDPVADEIAGITQRGLNQYDKKEEIKNTQEAAITNDLGGEQNTDESLPALAPGGLQNTPASTKPSIPGDGTTENYRDSFITQEAPDSEGDNLGVSLGNTGTVSGLTPEQAHRIQNSLSQGQQVSGFSMDNMIDSIKSDTDGKIMQALRDGTISASKADALMNRDFRASDRMDRIGGRADDYRKVDEQPTNSKDAMAYAQNLNNFTRNGEVGEEEALLAQQNYLRSLGGIYGVANSGQKKIDPKLIMQKSYDQDGVVTGESPHVFDPNNKSYSSLGGEDKGTTQAELLSWYNNDKASEKGKAQYDGVMQELFGMTMKEYIEGQKK